MNRNDTIDLISVMAAAWPWAEWTPQQVDLWAGAMAEVDRQDARTVASRAVRELDRPPSIAWVLEHTRALAAGRDQQFGLPESSATPASKETALAGLAAARAALQTRGSTEGTSSHGN